MNGQTVKSNVMDPNADIAVDDAAASLGVSPSARSGNPLKLKLILCAFFLLILTLGFNAMFSFGSLDKLYTESVVSNHRIIGETLKKKFENSLYFAKDIRKFTWINPMLVETRRSIIRKIMNINIPGGSAVKPVSDSDISVSVSLPNGQVLFSTHTGLVNTYLPEHARKSYDEIGKEKTSAGTTHCVKHKNSYIITLPVRDSNHYWVATIAMFFDKNPLNIHLKAILLKNIRPLLVILLCSVVLLTFLLHCITPNRIDVENSPKKRIAVTIFVVIGAAQIVFTGLNAHTLKTHYLIIGKHKTEMLATLLQEDLEAFLNRGIDLENLVEKYSWIHELIEFSPELNAITVFDKNQYSLLETKQPQTKPLSTAYRWLSDLLFEKERLLESEFLLPVHSKNSGHIAGYIATSISKNLLAKEIANIVMDAVTMMIISLLLMVELLVFLFLFIRKPRYEEKETAESIPYSLMRPATFLILFGIDISISFIPLHMGKLYRPILGLSKDMVMGLPISVEFLFVGLAIFISGMWNDRRGWHEPFLAGLVLAGTGMLYSWAAPDVVHFIISRAFVGIGYGFLLLAAQGFVIAYSDETNRTHAFAQFIAGLYAGSICGGATGALLADRIGYRSVFCIGAFILYGVIGYSLLFMRKAMKRPQSRSSEAPVSTPVKAHLIPFMKNRIVLSLVFLSSLPASIAAVGFLNYFSPIYLNRLGATQATIGRVLLIYGISLIYIGPYISRHVDASQNKKHYIFMGCVLGSMTFLTFYFLNGLLATIVAALLLGLSSCLIIASQSAYLLKLKVTRNLGDGKAIGIFRASSRVGQALGPIVFSGLIMSTMIENSITQIGLMYLLTAFLFLLMTHRDDIQYERWQQ